jgi:FixJ family two-component response regulator
LTKPFRKLELFVAINAINEALRRMTSARRQRSRTLDLRKPLGTLTPRQRSKCKPRPRDAQNAPGSLASLVRMTGKLKISSQPGIRPK